MYADGFGVVQGALRFPAEYGFVVESSGVVFVIFVDSRGTESRLLCAAIWEVGPGLVFGCSGGYVREWSRRSHGDLFQGWLRV